MKMKKKIAIVAVVAGLGLAGISQASGGWGNRGANYYNCPMIQNGQVSRIDPALQEKRDKFLADSQEIRKQMAMKRAEKQALLRSDNPDPQAVSTISGELFDLRTTLRQKAEEAGIPAAFGPIAGRGGFAPGMKGRGNGPGMDNQGYGPGMGRPGKSGRMGYMGTPGYGQGRF
jgi:hypothetical protein